MVEPIISQVKVGPFEVLSYLVACPDTRLGVIIDPGDEAERLAELAEAEGVRVEYLLCTHGHPDHLQAGPELRERLGAPLALHRDDDAFFASAQGRAAVEKELGLPAPEPADLRLLDGQKLRVGRLEIEVIHTPGHSPGSVCYLVGGDLFTGDTLFVGDVGRCDLSGGSLEVLLDSLANRLLTLPPETRVWPGHDYGETPASTLAREREENPYITDFILDE